MSQSTKPCLQSPIARMRASFLQRPELPFGDLLPTEWFERLDARRAITARRCIRRS